MVRILLFLIAFLVSHQALSERPYTAEIDTALPELWRWREIPRLDDAGFHCMTEADDGTLWFGVDEGVLQYDGLNWTEFKQAQGLADVVIYSICKAKDGSIYAASSSNLYRYRMGQWETIRFKDQSSFTTIRNLTASPRGGVWVASNMGAFYHHDGETTFFQISETNSRYTDRSVVDHVVQCPPSIKAPSSIVFHVNEDRQGQVWMIHREAIFRYDLDHPVDDVSAWKTYRYGWTDGLRYWPRNTVVHETQDGTHWLISRVAQYIMDPAGNWILSNEIDRENVHNEVWDFIQLRNKNILIISDKYLHAKTHDGWANLALPRLDKQATQLFESSKGFLWVAKERGPVYCVDISTQRWRSYQGLQYQCVGKDNSRWFINDQAEAVRQQGDTWTVYDQTDGLIDSPYRMIRAQDGSIWASGSDKEQAATSTFLNNQWSLNRHQNVANAFHPDAACAASDGTLYFGSSNFRVTQFQGGVISATPTDDGYRFKHHLLDPSSPRWTSGIVEDSFGDIWVCGSYLWKKGSTSFEQLPAITEGEGASLYRNLSATPNGEVWSARRGKGIFRFKDQVWDSMNAGLPDKFSHSLLCDDNTTWLSSISGVSRFQDTTWAARLFSDHFPEKGIQIEDIRKEKDNVYWFNMVPYHWSLDVRAKNYANISTNDFKCVQYIPQTEPPETTISFSVDRVDSSGNTIIEWNGISPWYATQTENLYYSYRINEGEWSPFSKDTSTTLLALKSGNYTFEVRARDDDFNLDPTPATVTFYVALPVWRQWWFIMLLGIVIGLIVMIFRSHERRMVEEQEFETELERVKLRFFTSISHELRTPLTVLLGPLQSMYQKVQDPEMKHGLRMMMRNGEKLRTLINQILDFRKLEAGKMKISWHYGDFIQSAQAIFDSLQTYAEMTPVSYTFEAPNAACLVWFDSNKLQILLSNLISNAIKYTPADGNVNVVLHIDYTENDSGKTVPASAVIRIEDSGPGIPAEEQEQIFERYYRSDATDNAGSGLGLALVKDVAQLLGGTVSVESPLPNEQQGTCFIVQLPIYAEAPEGADSTHIDTEYNLIPSDVLPEPSADDQAEMPTVLIIDDDDDIRLFIRTELSPLYVIHEAGNGSEGLARATELMPDLIISDVMMPIMDGTQLCAELKANPLTSHIPVILLTARASHESELEGVHAGADAYITKPFSTDMLKARVHTLLEARKVMQERFSQEIQLPEFDISITSVDQIFLEKALGIINDRLDDFDFSSVQLAKEVGMNERSLQIKIKALTGETPSTLIRLMRLKCAKKLLEEAPPGITVAEIASAVGMMDTSYFGKVFKKQFGQTPSALMKSKQ